MFKNVKIWRANRFRAVGDRARDRGDWSAAEGAYRASIAINPLQRDIMVQLGHSLKEQGKLDLAEEVYQQASGNGLVGADAYLHLGHARALLSSYSTSLEAYQAAIREGKVLTDPEAEGVLANAYVGLGDTYRATGEWTNAAAAYRRAIDVRPADADLWVQYAHAIKEAGSPLESIAAYRKAVELSLPNTDAHIHLMRVLDNQSMEANRTISSLEQKISTVRERISLLRQTFEQIGDTGATNGRQVARMETALLPVQEQKSLRRAGNETSEDSKLITIVLPVYNQANFLDAAIRGVLAQTYKNWELLIVNDGSSDNFSEVVRQFLAEPRIRILHQPNQKLPSALNNGFAEARGFYLTWTSADNVMCPDQLEELVGALEGRADAGFVYSNYEAIDDRDMPIADPMWRPHNRLDGSSFVRLPPAATLQNLHDSGDNFVGASFLWRADVHEIVGDHDEGTFGGEDYDFWLRMHLVTPFGHVGKFLYKYRVHDNTLNAKAKELKLLDNVRRLLETDKQRRKLLLRSDAHLEGVGEGHWRNSFQYLPTVQDKMKVRLYSSVVASGEAVATEDSVVQVIVLDVPLRAIDLSKLQHADVVCVTDKLTFNWLKRAKSRLLPRYTRLLFNEMGYRTSSMLHAVAHRLFEKEAERSQPPLSALSRAKEISQQSPRHVLLAVGRWQRGGLEQVVLDLALGFRRSGMRVTLCSTDETVGFGSDLYAVAEKIGVEAKGFAGDGAALATFVSDEKVEWVSYHHCVLGAERLAPIPHVVTTYVFHNSYVWFTEANRDKLAAELKHVDGFIAVSREVAAYAAKWFGVDVDYLHVVPNGTDLPEQARYSRAVAAKPTGPFQFLHVGTFNRIKLQDRLVRAFAKVSRRNPEVTLTLVGSIGDRPFFAEVEKLRTALGLEDRITIHRGVAREAVIEMMYEHHCFVLPSLVEGWSIALAEAAMVGLPVVCSDVGSARDMLEIAGSVAIVRSHGWPLENLSGENLYDVLNEQSADFEERLADAMERAIADQLERGHSALEKAAEFREKYSIAAMISGHLAVFSELLGRKAGWIAAGKQLPGEGDAKPGGSE